MVPSLARSRNSGRIAHAMLQALRANLLMVVLAGLLGRSASAQSPALAWPPTDWNTPLLLPAAAGLAAPQPAIQPPAPAGEAPSAPQVWQTEEAWQVPCRPFSEAIFLFGQVGARYQAVTTPEWNLSGRSGLGWKVPASLLGEVQLRAGPTWSWSDPLRPETSLTYSDLLLELHYRRPLPGLLQLEYRGSALPGENERLQQDLGLRIPIRPAGHLKVGARHQPDPLDAASWREDLQLYLGLGLRR